MTAYSRASVLIVEDEVIIAQNIQEQLHALGYDAFAIASSSEEALSRVSERIPDVVLMDIRLAGKVDGIATAGLLKARFDLPTIYLTAHADDATVERAKATEPFGYLVKPIKPSELHSAIEIGLYKHAIEKDLRKRERWFSTTVRSIGDAVITVDLASKITFMNPAAESLLGTTLGEALGRPAREVIRLELDTVDWPSGETPLDRALRERRSVVLGESILENGTAPRRIVADSAAPVMDDGEVLGAVMVFRDVTAERELHQQLEISDRLASLGTMAAGVAHEINNPLSVIIGNAQVVLESLGRAEGAEPSLAIRQAIEAQEELVSAANRIARIVGDLRAFSRPEPGQSRSADVRKAIRWAIRSTAHEFRHRAHVVTKLTQVPQVAADETRLGQVFVNLLMNAAHSISPGDADTNEVCVTTRLDGDSVVIDVSDTGCGIPPEQVHRIFEPFFTTKPVGAGTGLGLSICRGIVASMGGEITVESQLGEGTTFHVRVRASAGEAESPSLPLPSPAIAVRRGKLLVIDDEPMMLAVLGRVLDAHEVVATTSAREALGLLKDADFDLVLCDLMMPNMTGVEFYEELLRLRPEVARRVVFLTGGAVTSKVASFLETVPNPRIQKPFDVAKLRAMVQQLLAADQ